MTDWRYDPERIENSLLYNFNSLPVLYTFLVCRLHKLTSGLKWGKKGTMHNYLSVGTSEEDY